MDRGVWSTVLWSLIVNFIPLSKITFFFFLNFFLRESLMDLVRCSYLHLSLRKILGEVEGEGVERILGFGSLSHRNIRK